ncbi:unnamed protein product [Rotaria sp. Silwood1]|nr:unnamed protein product [Rotaria sp. Silwood1]CAF4730553.1 unnamed protein product [Rotaria sp. Silwood1]CAF4891147.1 unnamed protein product [Rotaria sp. Silwood1]CAF4940953.1 unnamed protein product [Rotaria sp. Silwood1]
MSIEEFKCRFLQTIPNHRTIMAELLENPVMLDLVQNRAVLLSHFAALKIEEDFWNYVANAAMPTVRWLSQTSKDVTKRNFINWDYPRTERNIQHRQIIISNKLKQAQTNLNVHLLETLPSEILHQELSVHELINIIHDALSILVQKDFANYLSYFEHKKTMLYLDIHEVYHVKCFYECNPTEPQLTLLSSIIIMQTNTETSWNPEEDEALRDYEKIPIDLPWNQKHPTKSSTESELMEIENLSQKMGQLSITPTEKKEPLMKDMRVEIEKIPHYLTKRNKSFLEIIHQVLSKMEKTPTTNKSDEYNDRIDELRRITILIYKIMVIQPYQVLWETYLKSGMGQLVVPWKTQTPGSINIRIWPKAIKTMLGSANTDKANENDLYLKFVHQQLDALDNQLKDCQRQLDTRANNMTGYSLSIQKMIELYIEKNLHFSRMEIEHKVELVHYQYYIRALKLAYLRLNPNKYQVERFMREICEIKHAQETTQQEYDFLQKQIAYYSSPSQSFDASLIGSSSIIDSVDDEYLRKELFGKYKDIAEQYRTTLFNMYLKSAEEQRKEYKKKLDDCVQQMYSSQNALNENQRLTSIMVQLITQRCDRISEHIKCVYEFKAQSMASKSSL